MAKADEKAADPVQEPEQPVVDAVETEPGDDGEHSISQWEFVNRVPTRQDVIDLLATLPAVWGVETVDFADYVQGLPSTKKVKVRDAQGRKIDEYRDVVTLYMGVAGRLKMLERAALVNGWRVDFEPEPVTPTGVPGMLQMDDRIVYREYVVISQLRLPGTSDMAVAADQMYASGQMIGRKHGTAWVPAKGGSQAAGSNPYEKVETSARGRAIAAWGFGVLPGSGIASLEEMQGASLNRQTLNAEAQQEGQQQNGGAGRKSRGDLMSELLTTAEAIRQERGQTEEEVKTKLAAYCQQAFGVDVAKEVDEGGQVTKIDLSTLRDGQIQLAVNAMADSLAKIRSEKAVI